MLARVVRSAAAGQQPAKRAISSTASAAKSLQIHPVTSGTAAAAPPPPAAAAPAISSGELAWCEIYGIDYEQQVQEALDESPLLVSHVHRAIPTLARANATAASAPRAAATTATSSTANAKGDIWNVVFGSTA
ncbi:hypothetical protein Gpo141_00013814 [Globisporangium polare]